MNTESREPKSIAAGEAFWKPSLPLPTFVSVVAVDGEQVTVKHGRRKPATLALSLFFGQGFRHESEPA